MFGLDVGTLSLGSVSALINYLSQSGQEEGAKHIVCLLFLH